MCYSLWCNAPLPPTMLPAEGRQHRGNITYESREIFFFEVACIISVQGKTKLSLLKVCENCIE